MRMKGHLFNGNIILDIVLEPEDFQREKSEHKPRIPDPDGHWRHGFTEFRVGRTPLVSMLESKEWLDIRSRPAGGPPEPGNWCIYGEHKNWTALRDLVGAQGVLYTPREHPCHDCFVPVWVDRERRVWTYGHGAMPEARRAWDRLELDFHMGLGVVRDWLRRCHDYEGLRAASSGATIYGEGYGD